MNSTKRCSYLDVRLVAPPGELLNITSCLILAHWPLGVKTTHTLVTMLGTPPNGEVIIRSVKVRSDYEIIGKFKPPHC